jgi:Bifunctional DNA primase/polymerase, N-terminal/Primase C terminal 2 (PriCT-2)/HNH endonuclease
MIVRVPLTQNQYAIIDDEDLPLVEGYKWHAAWSRITKTYYADTHTPMVNDKRYTLHMHRLITDAPKGMHVDHLNGDTLDNRRKNLKVCTPAEHNRRHASLITHCPKDHCYDEKNTYRAKRGHRKCRICHRERMRRKKMVQAALKYVEKFNWKVFPARMEDGKKYSWLSKDHAPGGLNWGMSDDPEQLRKNFSNRRWRDKCGVGIPTGAVNKIFVVEADTLVGHGVDGLAALRKLEREHGKLPKTLMAVSPSGSVHRYYRHPGAGVKITSATLVHGVDIKGDGGMVVAPPSRRGDGVYRWRNSLPIVAAPSWLLDMVQEQDRAQHEPNVWEQFGKSTRQVNMSELTLACAMLRNDDISWDPDKTTGHPGWNGVGLALFAATDGSVEGLKLFDAFSRRSRKKYNAQMTRAKWKAFHGCPPCSITAGTIFHLAEEAVPDYRDRCIAQDPDVIALIEEFHKLMDAS